MPFSMIREPGDDEGLAGPEETGSSPGAGADPAGARAPVAAESAGPNEADIFRACFEKAREGMVVVDGARRYVLANEAACELLGATRSQVVGARIDDFTPPEGREPLELTWRSFLQTGYQADDYQFMGAGGERAHLEFRAMGNVLPDRHFVLLRPTDVRRAEEQLAEVRHGLRGMAVALGPISDGAFLVDRQGCLEHLNRAACTLLGHDSPQDLIGRSLHDTFHEPGQSSTAYPSAWCPLMRVLTTGEPTEREETFVRRDGSFLRVTLTATPVPFGNGCGTLAVFREKAQADADGDQPDPPAPHAG